MNPAISVEKVSKKYQLGHADLKLREHLGSLLRFDFLRKKSTKLADTTLWALRDVTLSNPAGRNPRHYWAERGWEKSTLVEDPF